jgi:hypothetical protein
MGIKQSGGYLPLGGGTLSGPLTTSSGNIRAAATLQTDDGRVMMTSGPVIDMRGVTIVKLFRTDNSTPADFWPGATTLVPQTAPSNPASGWVLYVDSGDGNKLKAKASTGTVVTLGTP